LCGWFTVHRISEAGCSNLKNKPKGIGKSQEEVLESPSPPCHRASKNIFGRDRKSISILFLLFCSFILSFLFSCYREPEIKRPNTVTVGSLADAKRLLPLLASDSASGDISGWIYNGLTKYDKNITITGDLAESWDISPDGFQIIFHLEKESSGTMGLSSLPAMFSSLTAQ
jgi:peptide/nickel transport system substrate-binding protein